MESGMSYKSKAPLHSAFAFERFQTGSKTDILRVRIGNPPGYPAPFIDLWLPSAGGAVDLVIQNVSITCDVAGIALTQVHNLSQGDLAIASLVDGIAVTQAHNLTFADMAIQSELEWFAVTQDVILTLADMTIGSDVANFAITQEHELVYTNFWMTSVIAGVAIEQEHNLEMPDLTLDSEMDLLALSQLHCLTFTDPVIGLQVDNISLGSGFVRKNKSAMIPRGMATEDETIHFESIVATADLLRYINHDN
jgi:hypothetical protein